MTLEELRVQHPELCTALINEGYAKGQAEANQQEAERLCAARLNGARADGAEAERKRIQECQSLICGTNDPELNSRILADSTLTPEALALQMVQRQQARTQAVGDAIRRDALALGTQSAGLGSAMPTDNNSLDTETIKRAVARAN